MSPYGLPATGLYAVRAPCLRGSPGYPVTIAFAGRGGSLAAFIPQMAKGSPPVLHRLEAPRLNHPLVLLEEPELVRLLVDQKFGVADILDPHPPHHLPRDDLDVLVVDVAALQPRKDGKVRPDIVVKWVVLRKNLCRDRFQLVVMMQAAETRGADDTMRGR